MVSDIPVKQGIRITPPTTLGTGAFLPNEPLRSESVIPAITLKAGESKEIFTFNGHQRLVLFSVSDDGKGYIEYNIIIDHKVKPLPSVFIWQIVEFLGGAISSNGLLSLLPTGFTASSQFKGETTYITAMFTSDASGNVADESLTILYSMLEALGTIQITAKNTGTSSASVSGVLVTESVA